MTAIDLLMDHPAATAVASALVHFAWQGALIGLLTAIVLRALRSSGADVRYVVSTIALALMLTLPTVTAVQSGMAARPAPAVRIAPASALSEPGVGPAPAGDGQLAAPAAARVSPAARPLLPGGASLEPWLPLLLMAWIGGVAVLALRLLGGWIWAQRMRSHAVAPVASSLEAIAARLSRRLHIRQRVRLLESSGVDVPTVIGWLKPVVLLPASALSGLTPQQLEAVLAHELAHIRRHDYLVNLLQTLVETLLFYHPAVWWLSRRIRIERENCCDDLAVSLCGDPYAYAAALADLEQLRGTGRRLVMAANGGSLLLRVRRLLGAPSHAGREPGWLAGSVAIALMLGITAGVVTTASSPAAPQAPVPAPIFDGDMDLSAGQAPPAPPVPPTPPTPPVPPAGEETFASAPPAPPAPPSPPSPPEAPALGRQNGTFVWSSNGEKIELKYNGEIEFTDDDRDVERLSPGGYLRVREGGWFGAHVVEFRAGADGALTRRYWKGSSERAFEPEGREWLASVLPRFIRQSGLGAEARVARILKAKGPDGVLAEIALIEGGWGKRRYFTELLKAGRLDEATSRRALEQAGREIESDHELATLLISAAGSLLVDDATRKAYFDAARTIASDYEMRRVYSAALDRRPIAPALLAGILDAARDIQSDHEAASLLADVVRLQPLDAATGASLFAAVQAIGSDFEKRRVLSALASRGDLSDEIVVGMLESAATIGSDHDLSSFLLEIVRERPMEGAVRAALLSALDTVGSEHDKGRVLQALVAAEPRLKR